MTLSFFRLFLLAIVFLSILALPTFWGGKDTLTLITSIPLSYLTLLVLLTAIKWFCLVVRWHILLKQQSYSIKLLRLLSIVFAIDFAAENTPAGTGGLAASLWFFKKEGLPVAHTASYNTLLFIFDLAAVLLIISAALLIALFIPSVTFYWQALTGGVVILLGTLGLLASLQNPHWITNISHQLHFSKFLPKSLAIKIQNTWNTFLEKLQQLPNLPRRTLVYIFSLQLVHWFIRFSMLFLIILSLGGSIEWATTALIQLVSGFAGMLTFLPGGFPGTDLSLIALLQLSLPLQTTLSALLLWRLFTYHLSIVLGGTAFIWLSSQRKT